MLTMDRIHNIRNRYFVKGENISQIAEALQLDWKTVQKYIDKTDFNAPAPKSSTGGRVCPKLDPFKSIIDEWLKEDKKAPRKQRHTALRVYNRLREQYKEAFQCSYRTVAIYYAVKHKELFSGANDGFLPLVHRPGEAQVDFGTAEFYENGRKCTGKYLELSFPYSNKGYLQLFYGENMECLLEGLDAIFRHIGFVPEEIWFDNTKTIVTNIIRGGGRDLTERFVRFREHYGFQAVFMNPGEGHEKGNVENKVGYQRRNFMVPVPRFILIEDYNRLLLELCEGDADREHYRHNATIEELFAQDLKHCRPLPAILFDLSGKGTATANNWGRFNLYKGLHEYSASPKYANAKVHLKFTSSLVIVQDDNFREIVRHRRMYGETKQQSMEWLPYLKHLSMRPRALKYTGIYEMMPTTLQEFLGRCSNSEVGKVLKVLSELTDRTGFTSALNTVDQALAYGAVDAESLKNLYRRLYSDLPELPSMALGSDLPKLIQMSDNLAVYDIFLKKGVGANA